MSGRSPLCRAACLMLAVLLVIAPAVVRGQEAVVSSQEQATQSLIRVAIYDHSPGTANGPKALSRVLTKKDGFECVRLSPVDIQDGKLQEFDVLIVPGGSGSRQAGKLGEQGRRNIRDFVRTGGGFVGICAGSYLASSQYEWSLHLLNAQVRDRQHWARGTGQVVLELSDSGQSLLQHAGKSVEVYYGQGPLLAPDSRTDLPQYEELASYVSEIAKNGAPKGVMIGTTAIARATYGQGRVLCYSPHCEVTGGPNQMITAGILWVAGSDALSPPILSPSVSAMFPENGSSAP